MIIHRDATPADAATLAALGRESFVETFGHLYQPRDLDAFLSTHDVDHWAQELADPRFAVRLVEDDGKPIAYAKLGPAALPVEVAESRVELRQFYILKSHHGSGLAGVLMDWVLATARARGVDALYLSVFSDNHRARRFYARYGFDFVQEYRFMVGDHADIDHILRLPLKDLA